MAAGAGGPVSAPTVEQAAEGRLAEELAARRAARLAQLAEAEQARRDAEQAEHERQAEQAEHERARDRLSTERDGAMAQVRAVLADLGEAVRSLVAVDSDLAAVAVRAGRPARSWRQATVELVCVTLADAGLRNVEPLPFVPAATRARLLAEVTTIRPEPTEIEEGASSTRCAICTSPRRAEIDTALRGGLSLRTLEERYGVSRTSLSRHHRAHGRAVA